MPVFPLIVTMARGPKVGPKRVPDGREGWNGNREIDPGGVSVLSGLTTASSRVKPTLQISPSAFRNGNFILGAYVCPANLPSGWIAS